MERGSILVILHFILPILIRIRIFRIGKDGQDGTNPAAVGRGTACRAPGAWRKLADLPRIADGAFVPMAVFPRLDFPCPLGPGRGKQRPYGWGAGKKSCPSPKSKKSQFKQRGRMVSGDGLNWDYGG